MATTKIPAEFLANNTIVSLSIAENIISTRELAANGITSAQIASNAILTRHIDDNQITGDQIADNSVGTPQLAGIARGKIIVGDASGNPALLSLGSNGYVLKSDGSDITWAADADTAALTSEQVQDIAGAMFSSNTETGIAATYQDGDGTIDLVIGANVIVAGMIAQNSILTRHIDDDQVTTDQIAANTIATGNIADNAVDGTKIASNSILTRHIDDDQVTGAQLADALTVVTSVTSPLIDGENFKVNGGQGSDGQVLTSTGSGVAWEAAAGTTINNNANNRLITGSGTANTLEGEANLVFTGSNLGIGTTSPAVPLDIVSNAGGNAVVIRARSADDYAFIIFKNNAGSAVAGQIYNHSGAIAFTTGTSATERMRIGSGGGVGIGTTTTAVPLTINLASDINWRFLSASSQSRIMAISDNGGTYKDIGILGSDTVFYQQGSEHARIKSNGYVGIGDAAPVGKLEVRNVANIPTIIATHEANNLTGYTDIMSSSTITSNSVNHQYFVCKSGNGSAISDVEFNLRGDGQAYADGAWNGGGADYAEYFEWVDGNSGSEDRRGWSVVLVNEKIRRATSDDAAGTIIGVISGNPAIVGDSDIVGKWTGKYLVDDFGTAIRENVEAYNWTVPGSDPEGYNQSFSFHADRVPEGVTVPTVEENDTFTSTTVDRQKLNPDYVEGQDYIQRENRPEWDTVGLMGKLRILKTEQKGTNWIKMRDISGTVEEWLVR
jgi:hypothetical protein